jgi:peptidoglycan/xylan/chitin deacetylase (PgdA/CDA1 family)
MDVDQLRALAAQPGVEIGAHTVTHPLLARLDAATQWAEIDGAATALQDLLGRRPHLFSYPHGSPDAFDAVTVGLTRDAGFSRACTAIGGLVRPDGDPLRVPRRVVGDWEAEVFRERLERWLAAG